MKPEVIAVAEYVDWIKRLALPRWATSGFDHHAGRFEERLDLAGNPVLVPLRAMVQARQIYVYAHAAILGWNEQGAALADAACRSLMRDYAEERDGKTSFAFAVAHDGSVSSAVRDSYTHAFILFALAWMYRLTEDRRHLDLAARVAAFVDDELTDRRHGGLFSCLGETEDAPKRQNPLMHMVEAYLFLEETAPGHGYGKRASALIAIFQQQIFKPDRRHFPEIFAGDWSDLPSPDQADTYEPGHIFEWIWLLDRADHGDGILRPRLLEDLSEIAAWSLRKPGLIPDQINAKTGSATGHFRLWPHTEALKAINSGRLPRSIVSSGEVARLIMTNFLNGPFGGGWIDRRSATGESLVDHVPASSLYHLMLAAADAASKSPGLV